MRSSQLALPIAAGHKWNGSSMVCATASELTTAGSMGSVTDLFSRSAKALMALIAPVRSSSQFLYLFPLCGYRFPLCGSRSAPYGSRFPLAESTFRRAESTFPIAERTFRRAENNCPITRGFSLRTEFISRCAPPHSHAPPAYSQRTHGTCHPMQPLFRMVRGHHPSRYVCATPIHHS